MKLVLETLSSRHARSEKKVWKALGYNTTITDTMKLFLGGWHRVYRVWVGKKLKHRR